MRIIFSSYCAVHGNITLPNLCYALSIFIVLSLSV